LEFVRTICGYFLVIHLLVVKVSIWGLNGNRRLGALVYRGVLYKGCSNCIRCADLD